MGKYYGGVYSINKRKQEFLFLNICAETIYVTNTSTMHYLSDLDRRGGSRFALLAAQRKTRERLAAVADGLAPRRIRTFVTFCSFWTQNVWYNVWYNVWTRRSIKGYRFVTLVGLVSQTMREFGTRGINARCANTSTPTGTAKRVCAVEGGRAGPMRTVICDT